MKRMNQVIIGCFFVLIALPLLFFNHEHDVISPIDNKKLMENPIIYPEEQIDGDLTKSLETYLQERLGFRSEMVRTYAALNGGFFGEMTHPSYDYGRQGEILPALRENISYGRYHQVFVHFTSEINEYCEEREIPFIFVFTPSKTSVLEEIIPRGVNYDNQWVYQLMEEMADEDILVVDNLTYLQEVEDQGIDTFNQKYNANHWNDIGAFYGVNNILETMNSLNGTVEENPVEDFDLGRQLAETLPVSNIHIHEYEPILSGKTEVFSYGDRYASELAIDDQHPAFDYIINEEKKAEGAPRVLVFQGSYMNGMGYKFLQNAFGEYIYIHDYQNIINFVYYMNLFKPDMVIFEAAEYTYNSSYFDVRGMYEAKFNPSVDNLEETEIKEITPTSLGVEIIEGESIDKIMYEVSLDEQRFGYLLVDDQVFDMHYEEVDGQRVLVTSILHQDYEKVKLEILFGS